MRRTLVLKNNDGVDDEEHEAELPMGLKWKQNAEHPAHLGEQSPSPRLPRCLEHGLLQLWPARHFTT